MKKECFINIINKIKEIYDFEDKLTDVFDSMVMIPSGDDLLIKWLEEDSGCEINDIYGSDISYFIYDLDFGANWKPGMVTDENGNDIDFSTAEKLYDYLYSNRESSH